MLANNWPTTCALKRVELLALIDEDLGADGLELLGEAVAQAERESRKFRLGRMPRRGSPRAAP
jgi:hypothetical protein